MDFPIWLWINTYFHTIFTGMNIHKSQLNFDVNYRGTPGFDPSPYEKPVIKRDFSARHVWWALLRRWWHLPHPSDPTRWRSCEACLMLCSASCFQKWNNIQVWYIYIYYHVYILIIYIFYILCMLLIYIHIIFNILYIKYEYPLNSNIVQGAFELPEILRIHYPWLKDAYCIDDCIHFHLWESCMNPFKTGARVIRMTAVKPSHCHSDTCTWK